MAFLSTLSNSFDTTASVTKAGTEGFDHLIESLDELVVGLWEAADAECAEADFFAGLVCRKIETNKRVWFKEFEVLGPGRIPVFRFSCRRLGDDVVSVWEGGIADKQSAAPADEVNLSALLKKARTALLVSLSQPAAAPVLALV